MSAQKRMWVVCGFFVVSLIYLFCQKSQVVVKATLHHSELAGLSSKLLSNSEKNLFWDYIKDHQSSDPVISQKNLSKLRQKIGIRQNAQGIVFQLSSRNEKESKRLLGRLAELWKNYLGAKEDLKNSEHARKIEVLRKSLDLSIEKLTEFQKTNGVLGSSSFEEREKNLRTALLESESRLRQLESDFEMLQILDRNKNFSLRHMNVDLPAAQKYKEIERSRHSYVTRYKLKHPKMKQIEAEMQLLKENLFKELHQERGILASQATSLKFSLEDLKSDFLRNSSIRQKLGPLEQDVSLKRAGYEEARNQHKRWLAGAMSQDMTSTISMEKAFRQTLTSLAAGWLLLLIALGISSLLDRRIYHPRHILTVHKSPGLLAVTPKIKSGGYKIPLFLHYQPLSSYGKSISVVKNCILSMKNWNHKVILISTLGKELSPVSLVTNLSIALAQGQKKVLIIDCQFTHPRQHHFFKLHNIGIADILRGEVRKENIISRVEIPNLYVLPAGEGLNLRQVCSDEFTAMLKSFVSEYDFIFLDAPSFAAGTDSILVAQKTDGVILTVPSGQVTRETLSWAKGELKTAGVPLLGIILKEVPSFKVQRWNEFIASKIERSA